MIVQPLDSDTSLIYTGNFDADYKLIGNTLGMCSKDGVADTHATIKRSVFINSNGFSMPAWEMVGRTVKVYVVNDHSGPVTDNRSMASALNYFHKPTFAFEKYNFTGKFAADSPYMVHDSMKRGISLNQYNIKDLRGIYDLMMHLDANGGKIFEPLIARYVYSCHQISRKKLEIVGYFDLEEYLRTIHDNRGKLFTVGHTNALIYVETGPNTVVRITKSANNMAHLTMDGCKSMLDMQKANMFKPYVIMTRAPLNIRQEMKFPWSRLTFDGVTVFMTPLMSNPASWGTLQGGVDLLSPFFTK